MNRRPVNTTATHLLRGAFILVLQYDTACAGTTAETPRPTPTPRRIPTPIPRPTPPR